MSANFCSQSLNDRYCFERFHAGALCLPFGWHTQTERRHATASIRLLLLCAGYIVFTGNSYAADVTLAWDPNHESDLTGYGVYYKQGSDGPPYDLFGYFDKTELADPNSPTFTISGLNKSASYYFAVTAFDSADNESASSASVCAQVADSVTPCDSSTASDNSGGGTSTNAGSSSSVTPPAYSSSSSGGGGGCFIHSVLP